MTRLGLLLLLSWLALPGAFAQTSVPAPVEGDVVVKNFRFQSNEVLPELRLHYRTVGKLERDAQGKAKNAVLVMHGTGGSGAGCSRVYWQTHTSNDKGRALYDKVAEHKGFIVYAHEL